MPRHRGRSRRWPRRTAQLLQSAPWCDDPRLAGTVGSRAWTRAQIELLRAWINEHSMLDVYPPGTSVARINQNGYGGAIGGLPIIDEIATAYKNTGIRATSYDGLESPRLYLLGWLRLRSPGQWRLPATRFPELHHRMQQPHVQYLGCPVPRAIRLLARRIPGIAGVLSLTCRETDAAQPLRRLLGTPTARAYDA